MFNSVFFDAVSVFCVSFVMSLTSVLLRKRFVDQEQFAEWQSEIRAWNEEKNRATKTGDKKLMARLRRQEKRILQIQKKMFKGQMLSLVINVAALIVVWQLLVFYIADRTVAYLPFSIPFVIGPAPVPLTLFPWYIVCSYLSTTLVSRILGVQTGFGMQQQAKE